MTTSTNKSGSKIAARIKSLLAEYAAPAVEAPAVAHAEGATVEVPRDLAVSVLAARAAVAEAERIKDEAETALKSVLGAAHFATVDGEIVFSYAPQNRETIDVKALREELPEVAARYTRTKPVRSLLSRPKIVAKILG